MFLDDFGYLKMMLNSKESGAKAYCSSNLRKNKELDKTRNGKAGIRTLGTL